MTHHNWRLLLTLTVGLLHSFSAQVQSSPAAASASNERFGIRLATRLALQQSQSNVAVSPLLIQAALLLIYAGASRDSLTARDLRQGLDLQYAATPHLAVSHYQELVSQLKQSSALGCRLRLLSDFYTKQRYTFNYRDEFEVMASQMGIRTHRLDYDTPQGMAQQINMDYLVNSNYSLGEVVGQRDLSSSDTPFVHVSALTFQAPWKQAFDPTETQNINFFTDEHKHKLVEAMFGQHRYKYAEIPALEAQLIEVPFAVAELSMLIIYPNRVEGLSQLENLLENYDLMFLRKQMSERKVALTLPKFSVLSHNQLNGVLQEMGLSRLFSPEAELSQVFSSLIASSAPHLTALTHTSLLELDETGGQEGDSFSFGDLFRRALPLVINHPFFYAIGNDKTLLLAGHIVDI